MGAASSMGRKRLPRSIRHNRASGDAAELRSSGCSLLHSVVAAASQDVALPDGLLLPSAESPAATHDEELWRTRWLRVSVTRQWPRRRSRGAARHHADAAAAAREHRDGAATRGDQRLALMGREHDRLAAIPS